MNRLLLVPVGIALVILCAWQVREEARAQGGSGDPRSLGAPGAEHKKLEPLIGSWVLSMEGSDKKGTAQFQSLWDGRFVTEEATLPFPEFTLNWRGIYGFDRHKKKYTATWIDNMDTNIESGVGDVDSTGKVLTLEGQHENPRTGRSSGFLWRIAMVGDAKLKIQMFEKNEAGKEAKVLEIDGERSR
jgi:hypothetical protein